MGVGVDRRFITCGRRAQSAKNVKGRRCIAGGSTRTGSGGSGGRLSERLVYHPCAENNVSYRVVARRHWRPPQAGPKLPPRPDVGTRTPPALCSAFASGTDRRQKRPAAP
jgi:hypothetical protein